MDADVVIDRRLSRFAVVALVAAVLALPRVLVMLVFTTGWIYQWCELAGMAPHKVMTWINLTNCLASFVFEALTILALMLGVAAIVRIRLRPESEKGMGIAVCAIVLALGGTLLVFALWLFGALRSVAMG